MEDICLVHGHSYMFHQVFYLLLIFFFLIAYMAWRIRTRRKKDKDKKVLLPMFGAVIVFMIKWQLYVKHCRLLSSEFNQLCKQDKKEGEGEAPLSAVSQERFNVLLLFLPIQCCRISIAYNWYLWFYTLNRTVNCWLHAPLVPEPLDPVKEKDFLKYEHIFQLTEECGQWRQAFGQPFFLLFLVPFAFFVFSSLFVLPSIFSCTSFSFSYVAYTFCSAFRILMARTG